MAKMEKKEFEDKKNDDTRQNIEQRNGGRTHSKNSVNLKSSVFRGANKIKKVRVFSLFFSL